MNQSVNFYNLTIESLTELLKTWGKEGYRAQQLFRWVYGLGQTDFSQMTNISKVLRSELPSRLSFDLPHLARHLKSQDGTQKFLFDLGEGLQVESVMIPSKDRRTLCVSSEVGCNLACQFCFTGKQKLKRRLTTGEILGQFIQVTKLLPADQKITNIVFMGMGEPLDNEEAVFNSIQILNNPWGLNFSRRKVTVSTVGLVDKIPLVTKNKVRLAVSLNAANDTVRSQIMPINKKWPIKDLLEACQVHCKESGDRVTFEYVLLKGVTDSLEDARQLYELTRHIPCKINVIPFNEHPGSGFERPEEKRILAFHQRLMDLGAHVLRRKTMGRDIYAACGQLTSAHEKHPVRMSI